jgi:acyl transferase domain-containing protein/acyl carrier protein
MTADLGSSIAVVGMAGRFPGARSVDELWRNLLDGVEAITHFSDEELLAAGIPPELLDEPSYVKAGRVLEDIEKFDAEFFGFTPREAQVLDPQQRLFLEEAWTALEDAGCEPAHFDGAIGVFAGAALSTYLLHNLTHNDRMDASISPVQVVLGNDKDSLPTRVAYALDLRGPCYTIQSYCSTSLVAVCAASTSLLTGECDLALAGGAAVTVPHRVGYFYQEGGMSSSDARCRTFDADAEGTPIANGVAAVALKRAEDAVADGDHVYALLRGWAVNNDGALKVGFTAPGVRGQAGVVAEALANADLEPASIGYIEAHGTGTALGDAAEVTALKQVFGDLPRGSCGIGSIKTNLGHLDRAAGVTGLIKAALAVEHGTIPASLNYERPNPQADLEDSPFAVVTEARPWNPEGPRRAGVSAYGIGGTNAHVVVEQPPEIEPGACAAGRSRHLLVVSGRADAAADEAVDRLAAHLREHTAEPLDDIAFTLQTGRRGFDRRRLVSAASREEAIEALEGATGGLLASTATLHDRPVGFMLAGVGEHYAGIAAPLYEREPSFRAAFDACAAVLDPLVGVELAAAVFEGAGARTETDTFVRMLGRGPADDHDRDGELGRARVAQPAMFAVEYALARLLESWGIRPAAMLGYSLGEYVAACIGGALDLDQALGLVAERARLIDALPPGAMLAVPLREEHLVELLPDAVDVAAVNGPAMTVAAGPPEAIAELEAELERREIPSRRLVATHAFHSRMLDPIRAPLTDWVREHVRARAPQIPYVSNLTGAWITAGDLADPCYWATHACSTVRFGDGLVTLLAKDDLALLELGPGQSLGAMVRAHPACARERWGRIVPLLPSVHEPNDDERTVTDAVGRLWLAGVEVDWQAYHGHCRHVRVPLPTYPFQRKRYWVDTPKPDSRDRDGAASPEAATSRVPLLHELRWAEEAAPGTGTPAGPALVFADRRGLADELVGLLRAEGIPTAVVRAGDRFRADGDEFTIRAAEPDDYAALAARLDAEGRVPGTVAHMWSVDGDGPAGDAAGLDARQQVGFASVCRLARAIGTVGIDPIRIVVVSDGMQAVGAGDVPIADKATLLGPCKVIPQEQPDLHCRSVDVQLGLPDLASRLLDELRWPDGSPTIAHRSDGRHVEQLADLDQADDPAEPAVALREDGVYLVTGGLGGVGLLLAEHLLRDLSARVVLTTRSAPPPRDSWDNDERLRDLAALDPGGDRLLVLSADVTDEAAMRELLATVRTRLGQIDGVIHAAAVTSPESFRTIEHLDDAAWRAHFEAKLQGTLVLERVLRDDPPELVLLQSSISAVLGGLGFASYAASNAFLDAIPHRHRDEPTRWLSVDWDTWEPTMRKMEGGAIGASMVESSLTASGAFEALDRCLALGLPHTLVAAGDLRARMRLWLSSAEQGPSSGGTDRFERPDLSEPFEPPRGGGECRIAAAWEEVLGLERVGVNDNFFELGGNSLMGLQLVGRLKQELGIRVPAVALFESPTVRALTRNLLPDEAAEAGEPPAEDDPAARRRPRRVDGDAIAIVGMAGRFPGAGSVAELWENLHAGVEAIRRFTDGELREAGVPEDLIASPSYVRARPVLTSIDGFDAPFFGFSDREAALADPQHRLFLEVVWDALEDAGYASGEGAGRVAVFGGTGVSSYLQRFINEPEVFESADDYQSIVNNEKDALTTTVSYKLGLTGPSVTVQSFCSTSLVAVHLAARSLLDGECDAAIAGGVSIRVPDRVGYVHIDGSDDSADGHVRAFDAAASGVLYGDGAAAVTLRRLSDAEADGDRILAVIRGSAINNDGSMKAGYGAPSVVGQAAVVRDALELAGVAPEEISYVEAHGTGTRLGDPIEVAALRRAFESVEAGDRCAIGSVKTNLGHLDQAAGATGLIKTVLALQHEELPATLHFTEPNPDLELNETPFFVNAESRPWPVATGRPRRAGVSALGRGGTNAHVIVEEAPPRSMASAAYEPRPHPLVVSARTASAADEAVRRLAAHMRRSGDELADVAWTLQVGRRNFEHRRLVVAGDRDGAMAALEGDGVLSAEVSPGGSGFALLIPGGEHRAAASAPFAREASFREALEACAAVLGPLGVHVAHELDASERGGPALSEPAALAVEYALARLLHAWGVRPDDVVGHGRGERLAACLAGTLTLAEALELTVSSPAAPDADAPPRTDHLTSVELGGDRPLGESPAAAVGHLWLRGASIDWRRYAGGERARRVALPTYPFERRRHWIDPKRATFRRALASGLPSAVVTAAPAVRARQEESV